MTATWQIVTEQYSVCIMTMCLINVSLFVACRDTQDAQHCARWAADGRCTTHRLLMSTICARTCNLCDAQTLPQSTTAPQPPPASSWSSTTTQLGLDHHDGINATTTTLSRPTSSPVSSQSAISTVSSDSLLTSVLSVSRGSTLAESTVGGASSGRSERTDTGTTRSSLASKHDLTSQITGRAATAADDTGTSQTVTSSHTDDQRVSTSLRPAGHSPLAGTSRTERTTVGRRGVSNGDGAAGPVAAAENKTMPGVMESVTSVAAAVNDSATTYRPSENITQPATGTHVPAGVLLTSQKHADDAELHLTKTLVTADARTAGRLSRSFTRTRADTVSLTTGEHVTVSVTSNTDVISAAGRSVTSSSRDSAAVTSYDSNVVSRLKRATTGDVSDRTDRTVMAAMPPTTTASARDTSLGRHWQQSVNSIISSSTSTMSSANSSSSGAVELTSESPATRSSASVTHYSADMERWSPDNISSAVTSGSTPSFLASAQSTLSSIVDYLSTITLRAPNSSSHALATGPQASSSEQTATPHQLNASSFHGTIPSALLSSDATSVESISSPSDRSVVPVTDGNDTMKSRTALSTTASSVKATRGTGHFSSLSNSPSNVSAPSTSSVTQLPTVTPSTAARSRQNSSLAPSLRSDTSSVAASRPVSDDSAAQSSSDASHDLITHRTTPSYLTTRDKSHSSQLFVDQTSAVVTPSTAVSSPLNDATQRIIGSVSRTLLTANVNVTHISQPATTGNLSLSVTSNQTSAVVIQSPTGSWSTADSTQLTSSRQNGSEAGYGSDASTSTSRSHGTDFASTQSVATSAAAATTTQSAPLSSLHTDAHITSADRRHRGPPGITTARAAGLGSRGGHIVTGLASPVTVRLLRRRQFTTQHGDRKFTTGK